MIAHIDFETYSEAGYVWDGPACRWRSLQRNNPGIASVGATVYAQHPSAEVLCLAYDLDGASRLWTPDLPPPSDLFEYIRGGGLVKAHNSEFEYVVWQYVCHERYGWPVLPLGQLRCSAAQARAWALPGGLEKAGAVLKADVQKDKGGKRLLNLFSIPRKPTKRDPRLRIRPQDAPEDAAKLYEYCLTDVAAERAICDLVPPMSDRETEIWKLDQEINARGIAVDTEALAGCVEVTRREGAVGDAAMTVTTYGAVGAVSEVQKLASWVRSRGVPVESLDESGIALLLSGDLPPDVRTALETRQVYGGAAVKKLYALDRLVARDGRVHGLFTYHGAATGRWAGRGFQPQNLPNSGPQVQCCTVCNRHYGGTPPTCPWCGEQLWPGSSVEWNPDAVEDVLSCVAAVEPDQFIQRFPDPLSVISGSLRGLLVSEPGYDLLCSDYSAIEAVVLAAIAGEEWRLDVFRTHGMIYEMSASRISGVPFEEFLQHKKDTGEHHPLRKKIGKVAELASGYQGWVGAWKQFGADKHIGDDEKIAECVTQWRDASPSIVALWRGLESAAQRAVLDPGQPYAYRGITYGVVGDVLYCELPSGRFLTYHNPECVQKVDRYGRDRMQLAYWGLDSKTKQWRRIETYGGRLTENVVQAVSRGILAHAMLKLDAAGYPIVLHVHDEIVAEAPEGFGSVEEFERIMMDTPDWAAGWPIRAAGGWRGKRYRK